MAVPSPVPAEPVLTGPANALVARQPIYNGVLEVFAYELLFRVDSVTGPDGIDPDEATARTMLATLVEVGLDALVGDRVGYLNSTGRFILDGFAELAPPARVGFEVLESVEPSDELVMALHRLRGLSYPILLDDFVYSEERRPLLEACDIVKIDVLALSRDEIREQLAFVKPFRRVLLAEKVEDYETYEFCRDIGFDLFQGYFFCKPRTMSVQEIPIYRLSKLQLMAALMDDDLTVGHSSSSSSTTSASRTGCCASSTPRSSTGAAAFARSATRPSCSAAARFARGPAFSPLRPSTTGPTS